MPSDTLFNFRRFSLTQEHSALRIGTDAVLLGCSVEFDTHGVGDEIAKVGDYVRAGYSATGDSGNQIRILDIGCGCGIILLMLAQKAVDAGFERVYLKGIDIDAGSIEDAERNAELFRTSFQCGSGLIIDFEQISLQDFAAGYMSDSGRSADVLHGHFAGDTSDYALESGNGSFDIIVSNPPFFIKSLKSTADSDKIARHNDTLSQKELICGVEKLLSPGGRFNVILPSAEAELFKKECVQMGMMRGSGALSLEQVLKIRTTAAKEPKRQILFFRKCSDFTEDCSNCAALPDAAVTECELVMMKCDASGRGPANTSNKKEAFTDEYLSFTREFLIV